MNSGHKGDPGRLDSWKEIASHFNRSVRTVVRWEREEGLPVHRQAHDKRGTIYAYKDELDEWFRRRQLQKPLLSRWLRWVVAATVLVAAVVGVGWWVARDRPRGLETVAVCSFENETGDTEYDASAIGLAEGVARGLGKFTRAALYRKADEASGDALVIGRILSRDDRLIVAVELTDRERRTLVWSERYERTGGDLRGVSDEIVKAVAARARNGNSHPALSKPGETTAECYRQYLRGRHEWNKRSAEGMRAAVDAFQRGIEGDPSYAATYGGLAQAYALLSYYTTERAAETAPKARAAAMKAIEIDPSLAEAYGALAYVEMDYYWDWAGAERNFKRALELDPAWADGHHWYAEYLSAMGRFEEALNEYARALELDPLSPIIANNAVHAYSFSRDFEKAAAHCRKVIAMAGRFPNAHSDLGMALLALGRTEEAIAELETAFHLGGGPINGRGRLAYGYAKTGRAAEARGLLRAMIHDHAQDGGGVLAVAIAHIGLGEQDQALDWLERAKAERAPYLRSIWKDPVFDDLRSQERFKRLLRDMRFPAE